MLITNIGNNVSVADSITLTLPSSIDYIPSSTVSLSGVERDLAEPIILQTDSTLVLRYPLPTGLESGEEVNLSLQIIGTNLTCLNDIGINIATISTEEFFCEVSEANCLFNYISNDGTDFSLACNQSECDQSVVIRDTLLVQRNFSVR